MSLQTRRGVILHPGRTCSLLEPPTAQIGARYNPLLAQGAESCALYPSSEWRNVVDVHVGSRSSRDQWCSHASPCARCPRHSHLVLLACERSLSILGQKDGLVRLFVLGEYQNADGKSKHKSIQRVGFLDCPGQRFTVELLRKRHVVCRHTSAVAPIDLRKYEELLRLTATHSGDLNLVQSVSGDRRLTPNCEAHGKSTMAAVQATTSLGGSQFKPGSCQRIHNYWVDVEIRPANEFPGSAALHPNMLRPISGINLSMRSLRRHGCVVWSVIEVQRVLRAQTLPSVIHLIQLLSALIPGLVELQTGAFASSLRLTNLFSDYRPRQSATEDGKQFRELLVGLLQVAADTSCHKIRQLIRTTVSQRIHMVQLHVPSGPGFEISAAVEAAAILNFPNLSPNARSPVSAFSLISLGFHCYLPPPRDTVRKKGPGTSLRVGRRELTRVTGTKAG